MSQVTLLGLLGKPASSPPGTEPSTGTPASGTSYSAGLRDRDSWQVAGLARGPNCSSSPWVRGGDPRKLSWERREAFWHFKNMGPLKTGYRT